MANSLLIILSLCVALTSAVNLLSTEKLDCLRLRLHNAVRNKVNVHPLRWSTKIEKYSKSYAMIRTSDCSLIHSESQRYGENIFWGSGQSWILTQAVLEWASEKQFYDYGSNECANDEECGHYTQIVWRNSSKVGCAKVICDGNLGVFITCNYHPPGNYVGERPY